MIVVTTIILIIVVSRHHHHHLHILVAIINSHQSLVLAAVQEQTCAQHGYLYIMSTFQTAPVHQRVSRSMFFQRPKRARVARTIDHLNSNRRTGSPCPAVANLPCRMY